MWFFGLDYGNNVAYTAIPSMSLEISCVLGRGCLRDQPAVKLVSFLGNHTYVAVFSLLEGEKVLCVTLMGGGTHKEACTWILPDPVSVYFHWDPSITYPYCITVINHSHCNAMLSPKSPSSISQCGDSLVDPWHKYRFQICVPFLLKNYRGKWDYIHFDNFF